MSLAACCNLYVNVDVGDYVRRWKVGWVEM